MLLPDINVWLALAFEAHVHHVPARDWFETVDPRTCAFCRFTQQGFLRLATNPSVFGKEAVNMQDAWGLYDQLISDERVLFLAEPGGLETSWRKHTRDRKYSHKLWSDAYLASFAELGAGRNVTFDRGFRSFKGINAIILKPSKN